MTKDLLAMRRSMLRRPRVIDVVNACGALLDRAGASFLEFDERTLCARACADCGLQDFGDDSFREPLRILLRAYRTEAQLTFVGKLAAWHDTLRLLKNRLLLVEDRKRHPDIAAQEIRAPVFIIGLPRTGSTLLHNLFAQDPANRVPWTWEVMFPSPPPDRATAKTDPRKSQTDRLLRRFEFLAPTFKMIHPMRADWPTECVGILSHTFVSSQFQSTYQIPSYQQWIGNGDLRMAYEFHRRVLQHLQWRSLGRRWVLKAPSHSFALDAVCAVYPDAVFIHMHRDPRAVIASTSSLDLTLRYAFSDAVDPRRIGAEALAQWAAAMERVMAFRDEHEARGVRFVDVWYDDLVRDPLGTVRDLSAKLGLAPSPMAWHAMTRYLASYPRERYGCHRYTLAQFGLTDSDIRTAFRGYIRRFALETR